MAGEPGGSLPATRERIASLWNGADVIDHHGMTEVGPVTYQCPAEPGTLHVMEHAFLAEVIDPDGAQPVAPGAEGELVLTTLQRPGMPLLRYRTGDLVKADRHEPCACGSTELRLEGGIRGRTDDMVIIRGVNIFPSAVDQVIRSIPEITEYEVQVVETPALNELTVQVETAAEVPSPEAVAERAQRRLRDAFAVRIQVVPAPQNSLPRYEFKARRWRKTEAPHDHTA